MKRRCIGLVMGLLTSLASMAVQTWTIQNAVVDGMTPSQQLTNAVTQAANGDTILFKESAEKYQLDGASFMQEETSSEKTTKDVTCRSYVCLTNKALNFAGESDGKWSDGVVLRGNGNERFFYVNYSGGSTFRNLTFENFGANDDLTVTAPNGDETSWGLGGAGLFTTYYSVNILSNCVFRGNAARAGGAIARANIFDCMLTNNVAKANNSGGGAAYYVNMIRCSCIENKAAPTSGASYGGAVFGLYGASDCTFALNSGRTHAGALYRFVSNAVVSNCVFRGNTTTTTSEYNYGGGAMALNTDVRVVDCVFDGNSTQTRGGAILSIGANNSVFEKCLFTNNYAYAYYGGLGGVVYDAQHAAGNTPLKFASCTFAANRVEGNNASQAAAVAYCGVYSNCTFCGNYTRKSGGAPNGIVVGTEGHEAQIVDCVFSNNYNRNGGLVRYANCTNTLFWCNEVPTTGGVVKRCNVVDCRFVGNKKYDTMFGDITPPSYSPLTPYRESPSGDATESTMVKCDIDLGCIVNSVLVDCRIHTLTNLGAYCVFYGHNVATNCLIEGCNPPDQFCGLVYRDQAIATAYVEGSDYVNCTFADNVFPYMYHHASEYGIYTPFKNCLFYNNRNNNSSRNVDTYYKVKDVHGELTNLDSGFALSNCVYGATAASAISGDAWQDLGGNKIVAPASLGLAGAKAPELHVNKYSPLLKSPARGMGDARMFTVSDLDYAGNLRLRDGLLDAGCFQCWLNPLGMKIIFR